MGTKQRTRPSGIVEQGAPAELCRVDQTKGNVSPGSLLSTGSSVYTERLKIEKAQDTIQYQDNIDVCIQLHKQLLQLQVTKEF